MSKFETLDAIAKMAEDDNRGLEMSTAIVEVKYDSRGAIIGFGTTNKIGDDAKIQTLGLPGEYMIVCFAINREELKKYKASDPHTGAQE